MSLGDVTPLLKSLGISTSSFLAEAADKIKAGTTKLADKIAEHVHQAQHPSSAETSELPPGNKSVGLASQPPDPSWYENQKTLILSLIFLPIVGLYGLYKTSLFRRNVRIIISIIIICFAIVSKPLLIIWLLGSLGGAVGYLLYRLFALEKEPQIAIGCIGVGTFCGLALAVMMNAIWLHEDYSKKSVWQKAKEEHPRDVQVPTKTSAFQSGQPKPVSVAQAAPTKSQSGQVVQASISGITYVDVKRKFMGLRSDVTHAQQSWEWATNYKGRIVRWNGHVLDVVGDLRVIVAMESPFEVPGLELSVTPNERDKALRLKMGQSITFVGRMESQPHTIFSSALGMDMMHLSLENVVLE
jgi:hypothetical protein